MEGVMKGDTGLQSKCLKNGFEDKIPHSASEGFAVLLCGFAALRETHPEIAAAMRMDHDTPAPDRELMPHAKTQRRKEDSNSHHFYARNLHAY
jgi:hypothetical protein